MRTGRGWWRALGRARPAVVVEAVEPRRMLDGTVEAPVVEAQGDRLAAVGVGLSVSAKVSDAPDDPLRVEIDWGDGTKLEVLGGQGVINLSPVHVYAGRGTYTVVFTVIDGQDGLRASDSVQVRVGDVVGRVGVCREDYPGSRNTEARAGHRVWVDLDRNGAADPGEPAGVTDALGDVLFEGLGAGSYSLRADPLAGYRFATPADGGAAEVTVGASAGSAVAFAFTRTAIVEGVVYNDANGNGVRDAGEGLVGNRAVQIWNAAPVPTDAAGRFRAYGGLVPGTYVFRASPPSGWVQTSPTGLRGWAVTIVGDETVSGVEIGVRQVAGATIEGAAWYDTDGDGVRETSDGTTPLIREAYIDADGDGRLDAEELRQQVVFAQGYQFTQLPAGTYTVRLVERPGWESTTPTGYTVTVAAGQTVNAGRFGQRQTDFVRPNVVSSGYEVDARGPALRFAFDEDVEVAPNGGVPLVVRNLTTGADVAFAATYDAAARVAVFRPVGSPVLAGGDYQATLNRVYTVDLTGNALAASAVVTFTVVPGDANGDGAVGFADLVLLAQHYNTTNPAEWRADLNFDGVVNFGDLVILAQHYGGVGAAGVVAPSAVSVVEAGARDARGGEAVFDTTTVAATVAAAKRPVARPLPARVRSYNAGR